MKRWCSNSYMNIIAMLVTIVVLNIATVFLLKRNMKNNTKRNDIPLDMSSSGEVLSSSGEYSLGEVVLKSSTSAQD